MKTSDFYYDLPAELIAQTPIYPRDKSKLLCYNREDNSVSDRHFFDLPELLRKGDLLVINTTRVINARLFGTGENGRRYEIFLLKRIDLTHFEALMRPASKAKTGTKITICPELSAVPVRVLEDGVRVIEFTFEGVFEDILSRVGEVPLPPYITEKLSDKERYQTVYAKVDGSSAAPTAGLHFTPELFERLREKGIEIAEVLLHVGLGTFRPVKAENIQDHKMHAEYYEISKASADKINKAVKENRRVIAVGTTSVRTLEASSDAQGYVKDGEGYTDIFISPPDYRFKAVKGIITNFHLPESTLIMLVSAFIGREKTLELYKRAVADRYRFFSFGDAMLLL